MANVETAVPIKRQMLMARARAVPGLKVGSAEIKFDTEDLSEDIATRARRELRETDEVVAQALAEIRELVKGEIGLKVPDDDDFYKKFLRPCKWYATSAFSLMKRFYQFKLNRPRVCGDLVPSVERAILSSGVITPLPVRGKDGARLLLFEAGKRWKPKEVTLEQMFRGMMLALEAATSEPTTQVCGVRIIFDMDGLALSQVTYVTQSFARMTLEWVQKCLPTRLRGIHVINQPFIFNMVFAIFRPFIQEKLRKRIHFHGTDRDSFLSHAGANATPKRYGGELDIPDEPIGDPLYQYFMNFEDEYQTVNAYGYVTNT